MSHRDKVFIIAEAGVNHNGSLDMALKLIDKAVEAEADAVKFQTFRAEQIVSRDAAKAKYQTITTDENESQYDMLKKLELSEVAFRELLKYCQKKGIEFLSTPFDEESIDFLVNDIKVNNLKIPSGEITNGPLLLKAARTGKPIILSTGMSSMGEIEMALNIIAFGYVQSNKKPSFHAFQQVFCSEQGLQALKAKVILLHCTTEYPAPVSEVNLRTMDAMKVAFELPVGYSDHTTGIDIPIAAVAMGAVVIEKHFTLDRNLPGPDHRASLEPVELKAMVESIRRIEIALGSSVKRVMPSELKNRAIARKSIVAAQNIKKGEILTKSNLTVKRPGGGKEPFYYWELLGKRADRDYEKDELI